ncbi:HpcH/HpaI aldolase/citrate lyase family protein [Sandarakinorhabdus limnophila]|uniref:HpcH/HpaI aldolase/citrate lyase family protein n=1 Tax=Sandarakinorhabdus limnophila TaxID=210512 RepID=UPI00040EDFE6|nr:CoA ester lyase [Sandarakinorhabdus limnophila]
MDMTRLRSLLYLPANRPSAIAKARTLAADAVILDLEDAVQPDAKADARAAAVAAALDGGWGDRALFLRVNGIGTPWHGDDLAAAQTQGFAGIVVPKVDTAAEATDVLDRAGGRSVLAMIETPAGVLNAAAIAATPGVAGLIAGMADLAKALNCGVDASRTPLLYSLSTIVVAARAAGIACFDGVCTEYGNEAAFRAEAGQGKLLGFDGKTLIHPSQVDPGNAVFSPSADELANARAMIAAYEAALETGRGVATLDGQMVEILHVEQARRLLART